MYIREATSADNEQLQQLQAKCPQGKTIIVSVVNTPDFFARAKAYETYKVYVACESDRIIGSAACAIREVLLNGEIHRIAYGFQAFADPDFRRKGIASQLFKHREDYSLEQGAVLFYTLVMKDNKPAARYVESQGFKLHRTLVMPGMPVFKKMNLGTKHIIRLITSEDVAPVAELLNKTWQDCELYEPQSTLGLSQFISRTPAFEFENILVLQDQGEILACLGFWDWSHIVRVTVQALGNKMKMLGLMLRIARVFKRMPKYLKPGDSLKQIMLTCIGFKDPVHLQALVRYVNNQALLRGVEQIFCLCEPQHALLSSLKGFFRFDTAVHLYIKPLQQYIVLTDKPVFINGIDL
ncbi:MAG: GNAT family N-acetyltransferase [Planctomycetota bacterium]|jgi:GNAT superfamily N-acetyltransferase